MKQLFLTFLVLSTFAGTRFDGVDDKLYCTGANCQCLNSLTNQITISVWYVRVAGISTGGAELISKGRVINGVASQFTLRDTNGKLEFYYAAPTGTFHIWTTTSTFTATNVPYHAAFRLNWGDSNSATMFVNGAKAAGSWSSAPSNAIGVTNTEPLQIGTGATIFWKGEIFEPAIWNAYLTDPEIKSLSSRIAGLPLQIQPGLLKFYTPLEGKFAAWSTMSGSNAIVDLTQFHTPLTPLNSPIQYPMRWLSPMQ